MAIVTINGKVNTDWNIDFLGKTIESPSVKTSVIEIPLRDGVIDLTDDLDGIVHYNNRQIEMRFEIRAERIEWPHLQMELFNAYHGQILKVIFDDDPDHYWTGRGIVTEIEDHKSTAGIKIIVDAEPFRRLIQPLWSGNIELSEAQRVVLLGQYGMITELNHPRGYIDLDMSRNENNNWLKLYFADADNTEYFINYARVYNKDVNALLPNLYNGSTLTVSNPYTITQKLNVAIIGGDL